MRLPSWREEKRKNHKNCELNSLSWAIHWILVHVAALVRIEHMCFVVFCFVGFGQKSFLSERIFLLRLYYWILFYFQTISTVRARACAQTHSEQFSLFDIKSQSTVKQTKPNKTSTMKKNRSDGRNKEGNQARANHSRAYFYRCSVPLLVGWWKPIRYDIRDVLMMSKRKLCIYTRTDWRRPHNNRRAFHHFLVLVCQKDVRFHFVFIDMACLSLTNGAHALPETNLPTSVNFAEILMWFTVFYNNWNRFVCCAKPNWPLIHIIKFGYGGEMWLLRNNFVLCTLWLLLRDDALAQRLKSFHIFARIKMIVQNNNLITTNYCVRDEAFRIFTNETAAKWKRNRLQ